MNPIIPISNPIHLMIKSPFLLLATAGFSWLVVKYLPSPMAMFWLATAMALDLCTGLLKAWHKRMCSTSIGFKRTITKILSYSATIVLVVVLLNILGVVDGQNKYDLSVMVNTLIGFMTFIELFSVCENISAAYPNSPLNRYFIRHILSFLKGRLNNNPLNKLNDKQ